MFGALRFGQFQLNSEIVSCSNGEDFALCRELSIAEDWRGEDQGGVGAEDEDAGQRDGATSASSNQVSFLANFQ